MKWFLFLFKLIKKGKKYVLPEHKAEIEAEKRGFFSLSLFLCLPLVKREDFYFFFLLPFCLFPFFPPYFYYMFLTQQKISCLFCGIKVVEWVVAHKWRQKPKAMNNFYSKSDGGGRGMRAEVFLCKYKILENVLHHRNKKLNIFLLPYKKKKKGETEISDLFSTAISVSAQQLATERERERQEAASSRPEAATNLNGVV